MYVLTKDGAVHKYPYSAMQLRLDNPQTSFPANPTDTLLADYLVYPVIAVERPVYDPMTQNLSEGVPLLKDGVWTQVWSVSEATPEEIAQRQLDYVNQQKALRAEAYRTESDPLYFKAQRGEGTLAEWEAKVSEIKARYPYSEG